MLGRSLAVVAAALVIASSAPASADRAWEPTPGGWVSGPVEYLKTIPVDAGSAISAKLHADRLYVTMWRGFSIYDVSDPLNPVPLSTTPLTPRVFMEQPDTNGKILIMPQDIPSSELLVWDVSDPMFPSELASFPLPKNDHMWTCVDDCRYAYGGRGTIVDLKDPAAPEIVGDWALGLPIAAYHAIEEVAPGIVITGTSPPYVLDARKDPRKPIVRATVLQSFRGSPSPLTNPNASAPPAYAMWPGAARDRFALISTETPFSGPCQEESGAFETYDTKGYQRTRTFSAVDEYRLTSNGTFVDGRAPHNVIGCSPYAFDIPPDYSKSRRVAVSWFEQGMRLLQISTSGKITEIGGFLPIAGSSATAIWLDSEILYLIDANRGLDILRVRVGK